MSVSTYVSYIVLSLYYRRFKDILTFRNQQTCMKDAALLDYFVNGFCWAKEMKFTCQQISFIMALLQHLLDNIKRNLKWFELFTESSLVVFLTTLTLLHFLSDKQMSLADNFKVFTQIMNVSRRSPSAETDVSVLFTADQIRSITQYIRIRFVLLNTHTAVILKLVRVCMVNIDQVFLCPSYIINRCEALCIAIRQPGTSNKLHLFLWPS